jgi:hypothetical protein
MAGDFTERIDMLAAHVGSGTLTSKVEFDQPYAHKQHEDLTFKHTHGGGSKYLERALFDGLPNYMAAIAGSVLIDPKTAMVAVAEGIAERASNNAPHRSGGLSGSDHPSVTDNGDLVYDRPPATPRRSEETIEEYNKDLQDPRHYYGAWPPVLTNKGPVGRGRRNA